MGKPLTRPVFARCPTCRNAVNYLATKCQHCGADTVRKHGERVIRAASIWAAMAAYIAQEVRGGCKEGDAGALAFFAACNSCACCGPWSKGSDGGAVRQWNWRHGDVALFAKVVDDEPEYPGETPEEMEAALAISGTPVEGNGRLIGSIVDLMRAVVRQTKGGIKARLKALAAGDE